MIIFISCVKKKADFPCKAKDLYISDLFRKSYNYAIKHADKVYILSAKYGLLHPDDVIEPYEKTLGSFSEAQRKAWARRAFEQFVNAGGDPNEQAMFLCGEKYRKHLMKMFPNSMAPLKGLGLGKQLKWYKSKESK